MDKARLLDLVAGWRTVSSKHGDWLNDHTIFKNILGLYKFSTDVFDANGIRTVSDAVRVAKVRTSFSLL